MRANISYGVAAVALLLMGADVRSGDATEWDLGKLPRIWEMVGAQRELAKLEGVWRVVRSQQDGEELPKAHFRKYFVVVKGNEVAVITNVPYSPIGRS